MSRQFLIDLEKIARLSEVVNQEPLSRDFRRKYQRKYTDRETNFRPLSTVYEEMGVGFFNRRKK